MKQLAKEIHAHIMNWAANQAPDELNGTPLQIPLGDFEITDIIVDLEDGDEAICPFHEIAHACINHESYNENLTVDSVYDMLKKGLDEVMDEFLQ